MRREKPKPTIVKLNGLMEVTEFAEASTPNRLRTIYQNIIHRIDDLSTDIEVTYIKQLETLVIDSVKDLKENGPKSSFKSFNNQLKEIVTEIKENIKEEAENKELSQV